MPTESSLWSRVADLPLTIEDYALERLERDVSSDFTRVSTVIRLQGGGTDGIGEDVSYDAEDQDALQRTGPTLPLAGEWTLATFADHVRTLELWPEPARHDASVLYRLWAYDSAALDLALRQAGRPLHEVLGRTPQPVRFVVSLRLGEPPTLAPLRSRLDRYPDLQFKLDPTNEWTPDLIAEVAATGAVESLDLKGRYVGSIVDVAADPDQYERLLAAFPDAWLEDPHDDPRVLPLLDAVQDRITWDAIIHSIADIKALQPQPKMVNVKPSRVGGVQSVFDTYDFCEAHGIRMYGGGQFELGCGRGQIQYLASIFHADGPNDVAPGGYNDPEPADGLESSPLPAACQPTGFRWGSDA
ncbi:o-succinylbenzoate synthase [Paraconexibacter sp. AEG42_29]|uniref:O-succinylbenzoate synthase n=1 Tax=Paraconexibacter sp. AEG42_29 TaxID=2997339 RepID=A0AAU7AZ82_9ACTN